MVITHADRGKMANLSHLLRARTNTWQILVKYVKILDFTGFLELPEVKKKVEICGKLVNSVLFDQ